MTEEQSTPIDKSEKKGRRGYVAPDDERKIATKRFINPEDPINQAQIEIFEKVLVHQEKNGPIPGFPEVIEIVRENDRPVGYKQKWIEGKPLRTYLNERKRLFSIEEAKRLYETLVGLHDIIGQPHGDVAENGVFTSQNLLITEDEKGTPQFNFVDYGGTSDFDIASERAMALQALFIRKPFSTATDRSSYVEGTDQERMEVFRELQAQTK